MIGQHIELPIALKKEQYLRTFFNVNLHARHALYNQLRLFIIT